MYKFWFCPANHEICRSIWPANITIKEISYTEVSPISPRLHLFVQKYSKISKNTSECQNFAGMFMTLMKINLTIFKEKHPSISSISNNSNIQ